MKILAVRGKNLASLAGEFEVSLAEGPLAQAGLFAILGPTGAGKSTILDAICLALFDRTPRLDAASSDVVVGSPEEPEESRLAASDVRAILRKGTSEGFAEVDFAGIDGRRHRARWSVHRARGRTTGRFQPQQVTLQDLETGEFTSGTKSAVQAAIVACVGLTFVQFRRSVMLAQGEFAAFLKAKGPERAELLEKMTGTDLYQRISKRAFERAKEQRLQLERLEAELTDAVTLDATARQDLEAGLAAAKSAADEARARIDALVTAQSWYTALDALDAACTEAQTSQQRADEAWSASGPDRLALSEIEGAQALRPGVEAAHLAHQRLAARSAELRLSAEAASAAEGFVSERHEALGAAKETAQTREIARADAQPAIERARALDAQVQGAKKTKDEATAARDARAADVQRAKAELDRLAQELERATTAQAARVTELTTRAKYDRLADEWPRWQGAMGRARGALDTLASIDLARSARAVKESNDVHAGRVAELGVRTASLEAAGARVTAAEQALAAADPNGVRQAHASLQQRHQASTQAKGKLDEIGRVSKDVEKATAKAATESAKAAEAAAALVTADEGLKLATAKLELAEVKLEKAKAIQDLEAHRAQLVAGEPCPLCGAKEHPFGHRAPKVDERIARAREEVAARKKEATSLERAVAACATKVEQARTAARERSLEAKESRRELAELVKDYAAFRKDQPVVELPKDPTAAASPGELRASMHALAQSLEKAAGDEQRIAALEKGAKAARAKRDEARAAADLTRKAVDAAKAKLDAAEKLHAQATTTHTNATAALAGAEDELSAAFDAIGPFREDLRRDARSFEAACGKEAAEQQRLRSERDRSATALARLQPAVAAANAKLDAATAALALAGAEVTTRGTELSDLEVARSALLAGRPASEVAAALDGSLQQAREALEAARAQHQEAEVRKAQCLTAQSTARTALDAAEIELTEANRLLAQALAGRELSTVRAQLAHDAAWIGERRRAFDELGEQLRHATTVLAERSAQRAKHAESARPEQPRETLADTLSAANDAIPSLEATRAELDVRLREDDRAHERRGAKAAAIEAMVEQARHWSELDDAIGSADGRKLRNFAQGLTFGALLEEANHHLRELSRRYTLAPAAKGDLEFQIVDHDMADEVRSAATLSGGESFLVSLALALGLSSLGASRTRVESLFIDEGFGSLDGRSLDAALGALEALQATGRQIGVISHVERLAAKIGARVVVKRSGMRSVVTIEQA